MKVIFVFDDQSVFVANPEDLQLRQIEPGIAALVLFGGKNERGEDLLRSVINYPVVLTAPSNPDYPIPVSEEKE